MDLAPRQRTAQRRKPDNDDDLHTDGDQFIWLVHVHVTVTVTAAGTPAISSFTASPASIHSGSSSTLSWVTTGATKIAITPGTFTSTSASGSTSVSPTSTTTYTLTATMASGSPHRPRQITVTTGGPAGQLTITTTSCPGGTQGSAYAGCTIVAGGGSPPYTYSVSTSPNYPPLPEGMSLNASTGAISSSLDRRSRHVHAGIYR